MSGEAVARGEDQPLGPCSFVDSGSLGGSGILQSVPAQVALQVHEASLLHTYTDQTEKHSIHTLDLFLL